MNNKERFRTIHQPLRKRLLVPCLEEEVQLMETGQLSFACPVQASGSQFSFCLLRSELKLHKVLSQCLPTRIQTAIAKEQQNIVTEKLYYTGYKV